MGMLSFFAVLLGVCALFAYINEKVLRLPANIGLMLISLVCGGTIIVLHRFGIHFFFLEEVALLSGIDFNRFLMKGLLCFLLFAGAITVPSGTLLKKKWSVAMLALLATVISAALVGGFAYLIFALVGAPVALVTAMIFGSIICPTDPIAAIAILVPIGLPPKIETLINGESLFNDGVGVVLFTTFTALASHSHEAGPVVLFLREVAGGLGLGAVFGLLTVFFLRGIRENTTALLITLAAVTGCYAIGLALVVSGPIATVVLGLIVGGHFESRGHQDMVVGKARDFWHFLDNILNAVLFVLLGLQVLDLSWSRAAIVALVPMIPAILASRWLSVAAAIYLLNLPHRSRIRHLPLINLLTWTGMRGGLAVALALSPDPSLGRNLLLNVTFGVVAFSILVQGLTVKAFFPARVLRGISREV